MIDRELKIGDEVVYDANPVKWRGKVIGFRGGDHGIVILDTLMDNYLANGTIGQTNQEFIYKFDVDGKGIITYNTMWTILDKKIDLNVKQNAGGNSGVFSTI